MENDGDASSSEEDDEESIDSLSDGEVAGADEIHDEEVLLFVTNAYGVTRPYLLNLGRYRNWYFLKRAIKRVFYRDISSNIDHLDDPEMTFMNAGTDMETQAVHQVWDYYDFTLVALEIYAFPVGYMIDRDIDKTIAIYTKQAGAKKIDFLEELNITSFNCYHQLSQHLHSLKPIVLSFKWHLKPIAGFAYTDVDKDLFKDIIPDDLIFERQWYGFQSGVDAILLVTP